MGGTCVIIIIMIQSFSAEIIVIIASFLVLTAGSFDFLLKSSSVDP